MKNEFVPLVRLVERSNLVFIDCWEFVSTCVWLRTRIECICIRAWLAPGHPDPSSRSDACACPVYCAHPARLMSLTACCTYCRLSRLCRMRLQLCACPLPPHGPTRMYASPCMLLRVSLRSVLRARACRWGSPTPMLPHAAVPLASLLC